MSLDSFSSSSESVNPPRPPRKDIEEGTYALGIWEEGQTLYEFERNPLRDTSPTWNKVDHFEHSDSEVQRVNFQNATAEPQSSPDGDLQAVWVYTEELGRDESVPVTAEEETEGKDSEDQSKNDGDKGDSRTVGEIGKNTTYHRALHAVDRLSNGEDDAVPVKDVQAECSDPQGTVYSAMTTLYEKKLVNRKKKERDGKQDINVYWVSNYGEAMLAEHGTPS